MSDRNKTHNGRDLAGNFKVKQEDVEDLQTEWSGQNVIRDDVRLGGAVEDTGPSAGERGERIGDLVDTNRDDVAKVSGRRPASKKRSR